MYTDRCASDFSHIYLENVKKKSGFLHFQKTKITFTIPFSDTTVVLFSVVVLQASYRRKKNHIIH